MKRIWILLSVLAVAGVARAEEKAAEEVAEGAVKPDPSVWVNGWASFWFGNGYLSSSGNLSDTEPVAEQDVLLNLRTRDYGWLSFESWMKQDLHDKQAASHRRYFYIYEGLLTYGYAYAFTDDLKLVTDAGGVWDWLIAYTSDAPDEWYWIARQSLENPYVTPYWNALGGISPYGWARVRAGLQHAFQLTETLTVSPMCEFVYASDGLYDMRYGEEPDLRFLGGGILSCWAGFRFNWRFYGGWSIWGRFREFVLLDPVARTAVDKSEAYNARVDYPMVNVGLAYSF